MKATNIMWDAAENVSLPDTVVLPNKLKKDEIADFLSDTYDFCVFGFDIEDETHFI